MTSYQRFAFAAFALALLQSAGLAQTPAPAAPPPLTLEECVARALEKNFDVSIQRLTTTSATGDVEIAKAGYDPNLSLSSSRFFNKTPPNTTSSLSQSTQANRLSVSQKIVTGATVTATGLLDRNYSRPAVTAGLNPAYTGDVGLLVRQPLLKGAGTGINRAAIERAKLGVSRANTDLKGTVLTVVRNVEAAYYNLVFAREQREVRRFSLEVANKLLDENKARRSSGVATDLDVLQSEVGVANTQRDLVLSNQTVRNNEDALLQLIGQFEFDRPLGAVRFTDEPVPAFSFANSYQLARENQPDYLSSALALEQYKLDLKTTKDNRRPQLDLGGSLGQASKENSYGNASSEVWNGKGYNWGVDLSLTLPWGFRAENARYRQAQLAHNRGQARRQQIEQDIVVQVRGAIRAVETNQENVRISALAQELSQRQFEQEKARYEAGLSTFRFVQQSQADLDTARVNLLQAKVSLRISLVDLARLEASSLARYKINLAK